MSDLIPTGATEIIEALITGVTGLALTGLTDIAADARRSSDGFLLDWNDMTFKSSGWTTRQLQLTETDAATQAGWYRYTWDTGNITNPVANDVYTVTVRQTTLTSAYNVPQVGEIRSGGFVDTIATNLNATVGSRAVAGDLMGLADGAVTAAKIASNAITAAKVATDAIGAAQVAADAVTKIQTGLATPTNITAGTITTVTNLTNAPTAGDFTATMKSSITTAATAATPTVTVGSLGADAITASSLAASAVAEIADGVWDEAAAGHATAGTFGVILGTNLDVTLGSITTSLTAIKGVGFTPGQDDLHAIRARGDSAWITATGFAVAGDAMTLTAGALTSVQAKILDDATPFHGASIATIAAFGAPPSAATISTQVAADLATAHGAGSWLTADISTLATSAALASVATDTTKARRALYNRRTLSAGGLFTLYADDAVTSLYTATVTDVTGGAITVSAGEPARTTALA